MKSKPLLGEDSVMKHSISLAALLVVAGVAIILAG